MKSNKTHLVMAALLSLVFLGCQKGHDCVVRMSLYGEWTWVESQGGIGGWTLTPESENLTRKLVIDDFYYEKYVNDSLVLKTEYDLTISEDVLLGTEEKTVIRFPSGEEQAIIISKTELQLIEQCFDCFHHRYKRK